MKNSIKMQSDQVGSREQLDTIIYQTCLTLRSGEWAADIENTYTDQGERLVRRTITIEYAEPPPG